MVQRKDLSLQFRTVWLCAVRAVVSVVCLASSLLTQPAPTTEDKPGHGFAFHYKMLNRDEDKLGEGQFATVRKAIQKKTGKVVAVKCILVSKLTKEDSDALKVEIEVMRMVSATTQLGVYRTGLLACWEGTACSGTGTARAQSQFAVFYPTHSTAKCSSYAADCSFVAACHSCDTRTSSTSSTILKSRSIASWSWS
jgi:hypothetical protein